MFKPLLRTLPCLSGNFTLACKLDKYKKNSPINFECGISNAVLMPLQNNLANKHVNVSLLYDAYEYDVKEYFKSFSSIFYTENYEYDKNNIYNIDLTGNPTYKNRNLDYEFGCKRNIMDSGYQYMFYAPFYINDTTSLPDEFIIHIEFDNNRFKDIHIKIFDNNDKDSLSNYLSVYLKRYVEQIDERCIFCLPQTNQGTYYGIDVQYGGFKNVRDNVIGVIYNKQLSLNDYDKIICNGFQRNKLIMRQIIPLSFMFNIEDILTKSEYRYNINNIVRISGWYEHNGMKYDFYDFDTNYKELIINNVNVLNPTDIEIKQNKNLGKSLHESKDTVFKYDNTISKTYNRWCLLSTLNDDNKYITNSSDVFLDINNNYYNIPVRYSSNSSYLYYNDGDIDINKSRNSLTDNNINSIISQTKFKEADILNETNWYDVFNNKCIIGGLLYDLNSSAYTYSNEYSSAINDNYSFSKYQKIDKFNVFAYVNVLSSDAAYYCKYSVTSPAHIFNSTYPNNYEKPFCFGDILTYYSYYENNHSTNTLFDKLTYVNGEFIDNNGNVVTDDIYIDYSYHYYLSNIYSVYKDMYGTKPQLNGFEVLNDIDPLSFINAVNIAYTNAVNNENITDVSKITNLRNVVALMNYSSDNITPIFSVSIDNSINNKNSRIAVNRIFISYHDIFDSREEAGERITDISVNSNKDEILNSYFHYVPSYKSASFMSHGHFEKNNIHYDYVYCDMWNLSYYVDEWNKEHFEHINILDTELNDANSSYVINNAYIGIVSKEQYSYYLNRMYGYENYEDETFVMISYADCVIPANSASNLSNKYTIDSVYKNHEFVKLSEYLVGREENKDKLINDLISTHRLYHKNKLFRLSSKHIKRLNDIYNKYKNTDKDLVSLILYTTNTDIIDKFNIDYARIVDEKQDITPIYIPLTSEILWSEKSQKETNQILSSRNIKLVENDWALYDMYDIVNCNYLGDSEYCIDAMSINESIDENLLYHIIDISEIETDNTIHIIDKDGTVYAYYYITLNLYNNAKSFTMNTDNINNTFDVNKYTINDLLPFISSNILDYILLNTGSNNILEKSIINILMNKYFDKAESTVLQTDTTSVNQISRYFTDITPVLEKKSSVLPYSLIYKDPSISQKNRTKYDTVIYEKFEERSIEYDSSIYESKTFGIPCLTTEQKEESIIEEYEYKFYNDNKLYFLETYFTITDKQLYTIEEIREHEKNEYVLNNVFRPRVVAKMHSAPKNEDEILFLFNRYKIEYESYPVRTDLTGEYKLHKLKYIFTLR